MEIWFRSDLSVSRSTPWRLPLFCCALGCMVYSCVGNAMATPSAQQQQHQDYFRSVSSESTTYMMVPAAGPSGTRRKEAPSKMWVAMVVIVVVVLQIASTTGLFVYLNMSISEVRAGFLLVLRSSGAALLYVREWSLNQHRAECYIRLILVMIQKHWQSLCAVLGWLHEC